MARDLADSSCTDDDLLPSHNNRVPRGGRAAINGRSVVGCASYHRVNSDMESQIHHLEKEAYRSVLLAFKAQSDALTWEKESLITELRDKLRVSDGEHRELLTRVNADDVICQIRKRRQVGGHHGSLLSTPQPVHDLIHSPTVSASHKKQRTSQSAPLSFGMAPQALQPQSIAASIQLSSSAVKQGPTLGAKHDQPFPGLSSMKSMPYPSTAPTVRDQFTNCSSSGAVATKEPAEAATHDPLIGRNMAKRRLEVDKLCEAIDKFIRKTLREANLGISKQGDRGGQGCGFSNSMSHGVVPGAVSGRRSTGDQFENELAPSQNGVGKKVSDDTEILHTETLVNELAGRVFGVRHPDLLEIEKAKKMLKEHEQALIDVITKLADASDSGSDEEQPFPNGQSFNREQE